jgi:hypothetical protein
MGICLALFTISDENIERVLADPPLLSRALGVPEDDEWMPPPQPGFFARLFGARAVSELPPGSGSEGGFGEVEHFDIDKAWAGLHFLLTGTEDGGEPPLNALLVGGETVESDDLESGARLFTSAQVRALDSALGAVDRQVLLQRYDPAAMTALGLYPQIWDRADERSANFDYLLYHFKALKEFVAKAANSGLGLAIYFT